MSHKTRAHKNTSISAARILVLAFLFLFILPERCLAVSYVWTGTTSTAWATTTNWSPNGNPGSGVGDIVSLPATTNQPILTVTPANALASVTFTGLTGTLTVNGATLTVSGAVTLNSNAGTNVTHTITGTGTLNCGSISVGSIVTPTADRTTILTSSIANFTCTGILTLRSSQSGTRENNATFSHSSGTLTVSEIDPVTTNSGNSIATYTLGSSGSILKLTGASPFGSTGNSGVFTSTLSTSGATVEYSGGSQIVKATVYPNLTLSGSGSKTLTGVSTITGNFIMAGTASATAETAMTITGNLELGSGTTFTGGAFTHNLLGNWTNNGGTYIGSGSTINFMGPATKYINGSGSTTFENIVFASASSYIDSADFTCSSLTFSVSASPGCSLTVATNSVDIVINGPLTMNQPSANTTTAFFVNDGTVTVTGLTSTSGTNNFARITKFIITNGTFNAYGGFTFTGTKETNKVIDMSGGAGVFNLKGALTVATSTLTAGTASTFNYVDNTAQSIVFFPFGAYNNLGINNTNASGATLTAALTTNNVTGNITVGDLNQGSYFNTGGFSIGVNNSKAIDIRSGSEMDASSGTVNFGTGGSLDVRGTLDAGTTVFSFGSAGAVNLDGILKTANLNGFSGGAATTVNSSNNPSINLGGNSRIEYDASTTQILTATIYDNLILANGSKTAASGTIAVNDSLIINSGATYNGGTNNPSLTIAGNFHNDGTFTQGGGLVTFDGSAAQKIWGISSTAFNDITISNTSDTVSTDIDFSVASGKFFTLSANSVFKPGAVNIISGAGTITGSGTALVTRTAATPDFCSQYTIANKTLTNLMVDYSANANQTICAATYNGLRASGSGTKTASGNVVVTGTFSVDNGIIVNMSSNKLSGTMSSVSMNGTLKTSETTSTPIPSGKTWGGTVEYAATAGGQTIAGGSYNNLTLDNSSGTNSAGGDLTVNGTLTTTSGGTMDMTSAYILAGSLTAIVNGGTIKTAVPTSTSSAPIPASKTWNGTVDYYAAAGSQTIAGGIYSTLTLSNTTGTQTAGGNITASILNHNSNSADVLNMGTYQLTVTAVNNSGNIRTQNTGSAPISSGLSWGGTVTFDGSSAQTVPANTFSTLVVGNSSVASMSGTVTVGADLTFNSNGILSIGANTLNLAGTITNTSNGGLRGGSTSDLNLTGTTSTLSLDQTTSGLTNVIRNLTINASGQTFTLGNALRVVGTLTPTLGTLKSAGKLIMASDATATAIIAAFPASGAAISDTVLVERYIPGRRAYRFLAPEVSTNGTIRKNWQENNSYPTPGNGDGLGTHITGSTDGSGGFDITATGNPSMYTFNNATQQWAAIPNTNATFFTAGTPYRIFVRGDRTVDLGLNNPLATNTVLRAMGTIYKGDKTPSGFGTNAGDFNFTGNPYVAPVNMQTILTAATNLNPQYYYIWDPTRSTRGAYVTVDVIANSNNVSGSLANRYLQPGQACFVVTQSAGTASLTYTESSKASISDETSVFKTNGSANKELRMNLYLTDSLPKNPPPQDGLVIRYDPAFDDGFDFRDALKPGNQDEDIGIDILSGTTLSFESRSIPEDGDSSRIYFHQNQNPSARINYTLVAVMDTMPGVDAFLFDRFTKLQTQIRPGVNISYDFTVDPAISASKAADRFVIYYNKASGIMNKHNDYGVKVFPDPSGGTTVKIDPGILAGNEYDLRVFDISGKIVHQEKAHKMTPVISLDFSPVLAPGAYLLEIGNENQLIRMRFIVQ
jgi:hypothetical protein